MIMTPMDRFYMLLGQQPDHAMGQFAPLSAKRLQLLNTHTAALTDHQVFFCI
jgi:hypothetical protein